MTVPAALQQSISVRQTPGWTTTFTRQDTGQKDGEGNPIYNTTKVTWQAQKGNLIVPGMYGAFEFRFRAPSTRRLSSASRSTRSTTGPRRAWRRDRELVGAVRQCDPRLMRQHHRLIRRSRRRGSCWRRGLLLRQRPTPSCSRRRRGRPTCSATRSRSRTSAACRRSRFDCDVPDGIDFFLVERKPGWKTHIEKRNGRIVAVVFDGGTIPPDGYDSFRFIAKNPVHEGTIAWDVEQSYARRRGRRAGRARPTPTRRRRVPRSPSPPCRSTSSTSPAGGAEPP